MKLNKLINQISWIFRSFDRGYKRRFSRYKEINIVITEYIKKMFEIFRKFWKFWKDDSNRKFC